MNMFMKMNVVANDLQLWESFIKIVVFLPFIIFLIYLVGKYGGSKVHNFQSGKLIKIIERVPVSKDNSLMIVIIGEKPYVISSTNGKMEILLELDREDIEKCNRANTDKKLSSIHEFYAKIKGKKGD
jgi:flagellar protein FliO/FliZ